MNNNAIEQFINAVKEPEYETNTTYSAIVSRVDSEGVAWVNLAGSEKETPTASTSADVKAGDVVTVQWSNNKLYIAGNYSNPSAGVIRVANVEAAANTAREAANNAVADAGRARDAAEQAEATAAGVESIAVAAEQAAQNAQNSLKSVVQGATTVEKAVSVMQTALEAVAEYDPNAITETFTGDGTETDFTLQTKATNVLSVTVDGESAEYATAVVSGVTVVTITPAPENDASISISYDTTKEWFWHDANGAHVLGDDNGYRNDIMSTGMKITDVMNEESVAEFGASGAQIGQTSGAHSIIDVNGQRFYANDGTTLLADIGYGAIPAVGQKPYWSFGIRSTGRGQDYSNTRIYSKGDPCMYNDKLYFCLIDMDAPEEWTSSHWRYGLGAWSAMIGQYCIASGTYSYAEGNNTIAIGTSSHSEGTMTTAFGDYSHSEGMLTKAFGRYSHAGGRNVEAYYDYQTVIGKYNDNQPNTAFEIGNGTSDSASSNALTVDWSGRVSCGDYAGNFKSIFDIFYPVGSYYETSLPSAIPSGSSTPNATDLENLGSTWFDPNYAFGGTWVLETAGLVHIGAGTGYTLGDTGGSKYIQEHTHGFTQPVYTVTGGAVTDGITGGSHHHATSRKANAGSGTARYIPDADSTSNNVSTTDTTHKHNLPSHSHTVTRTTNGAVNAVSGLPADQSTGSAGNMPPYIVVNRWHRTA